MPQLIIQPSNIDSYIANQLSVNTNYGTSTELRVGSSDVVGDTQIRRAILKFDFSALPNFTTLISTPLSLYTYAGVADRTLWANRLTRTNWTEAGVTWNKYDGSNNWTSAGGDFTTTDRASALSLASGNWVTWNVLALAQYAQLNTSKILHILIKDSNETDEVDNYFYSSEYATDTTKCPKLILNYIYKNGLWFGNG